LRLAALYDIHANAPALEAVLRDVQAAKVDRVVVGGDVFPGPMPRETIALLRALTIPVDYIRGNGDRAVLECVRGLPLDYLPEQAREAVRWTADQLDPDDAQFIASWPATTRLEIPSFGEVLFCHATPQSDTEIFTRLTADDRVSPLFQNIAASVVICGHTHMQFDRTVGIIRVVNAGSVGMPFGRPGADWLLIDSAIRLQHSDYDLDEAARRVRATAYPQAEDFATKNIVNPPTEESMLALFSR